MKKEFLFICHSIICKNGWYWVVVQPVCVILLLSLYFNLSSSIVCANDTTALKNRLKYYKEIGKNQDSINTILWNLSYKLTATNPLGAVTILNELEKEYIKEKNYFLLTGVYTDRGRIYSTLKLYYLAIDNYLKAYQFVLDEKMLDKYPYLLVEIGNTYWALKMPALAHKYYKSAIETFQKKKDKYGEAVILNNLGILKRDHGELDSALFFFNSALKIREKLDLPFLIAHSYQYIGGVYTLLGQEDTALSLFRKALHLAELNPSRIFNDENYIFSDLYKSIGVLYLKKKEYDNAIKNYKIALSENEIRINDRDVESGLFFTLSEIYLERELIDSALYYAQESLRSAKTIGALSREKDAYRNLSKIYEILNDIPLAYDCFKMYNDLNDSIGEDERNARENQLKLTMETLDKENEIDVLKEKNKKIQILTYGISLTTLLIIGFFIFLNKVRRRNANKVRQLANSTFEGLLIHDKGVVIDANQKLCEVTGYLREEIINRNIYEFFDPSFSPRVSQSLKSHDLEEYELILNHKNGSKINVEILSKPIEYLNKKVRVAAIRDITSRLETERMIRFSEANLQALINNTIDIICSVDLDLRLITHNANFQTFYESLTGYTLEKGQYLLDHCPPAIAGIVKPLLNKAMSQGMAVSEIIIPDQKSFRFFEISLHSISLGEEIRGVTVYLHDITEKRLLLNELNDLNSTKDKFFSIIAHDLKSPFTGIMGFSELLVSDYDKFSEEERIQYIRSILELSGNTYRLLENLLEWARSQTGHLPFSPEWHDLGNVVKEVLKHAVLQAEVKKIKIVNNIKINTLVYFDENMIFTVLRNLVSNAIKFTHPGGQILIESKLQMMDSDEFLELSVSDNGIGISSENISKLFKIDQQFKMPGTAHEKGTGLGLILCREFIEKHGGTISVISILGSGSTVNIKLPLKPKNQD